MIKKMKRFISVLLALACVMCTLFSTSVFAAENLEKVPSQEVTDDVTANDMEASDRALGTLLATGGGTIYNGMGSISVTLPKSNFGADFVAVLGYCDVNTVVTCTVRDPSGNYFSLGSMSGNGSSTNTYSLLYASAGTYTFSFVTGTSSPVEIACYIYD